MGAAIRWVTDRLHAAPFLRSVLDKVFPRHWSFMLGEIALYSFVVLIVTGLFLTLFFQASSAHTVYDGSYRPLQGTEVSQAYASVLRLSFDVPGGLLIRQIHHWAAVVFMAAITLHLSRIFFTGAFRKPREPNWMIGVTLLVLGLLLGFTGYSMPDDLLSGLGLRIAYSILLSVPLIGTKLAFLIFGGEFPGNVIIGRLYPIHIFVLPLTTAGLIAGHLAMLWRHKHAQFRGPGRRNDNVVGERLYPAFAMNSIALMLSVFATLAMLGGFAQINPVWLWGPFDATAASAAAQPDWYVGFLEGAIRLAPPLEFRAFGRTIGEPFLPTVVLPGVLFGLLYAYPYIEQRFLGGDDGEHHLLDRPRDNPTRTAIGVMAWSFYTILLLGGAQDMLSTMFEMDVYLLRRILQASLLIVPPIAFWITRRIATQLRDRDEHPERAARGDVLVRTSSGGYTEAGIRHE